MKITEILNGHYELDEFDVPDGIKKISEISKLRNVSSLRKLNIEYVESLESLEGCPEEIEEITVVKTSIRNLIGGPKVVKYASFEKNELLTSLKGCPEKAEIIGCTSCSIQNLKGVTATLEAITLSNNPTLILHNAWKDLQSCESYMQRRDIHPESGLLGLLRVKNLNSIYCDENSPLSIVAKYVPLRTMSDIMKCKQELINAGFKSNAKF